MGGFGSGGYGFMGSLIRKKTVEETFHLHIQYIKAYLDNKKFTISWDDGKKSIGIATRENVILLFYSVNGERILTKVNIDSTNVGYGKRPWFICPSCNKRTARVYIADKHFKCRDCSNLTYLTCQESGDPLDYLGLKIRRLQRKLGLKDAYPYDIPYKKPKNMHYKTYKKLRNKLIELQDEREQAFLNICESRWGVI